MSAMVTTVDVVFYKHEGAKHFARSIISEIKKVGIVTIKISTFYTSSTLSEDTKKSVF